MHTVWKGAISFGLVNIPVKMFTATENKDIKFRYLHRACNTAYSGLFGQYFREYPDNKTGYIRTPCHVL
jgi:hypothetical protein